MAGRAKKKCLFEDDVRAMLGMPKIEFADEDTTLEKQYSHGNHGVRHMRGDDDDDDEGGGWRSVLSGRNGYALVCACLLVFA